MIIGIAGFAGSGKGTVADILTKRIDLDFTKVSFADAVKDATSAVFGWPRWLLEGDTDESREFREKPDPFWSEKFEKTVTPRWALQTMGTEAGRNVFHQDLWVHVVEKKIQQYKNVVIPDVRFPNEIEAIRKQGGFIIRVTRGPDPEWYDLAKAANDPMFLHSPEAHDEMEKIIHYSEWAWIGQTFDYLIDNNGSINELHGQVNHMLQLFEGPVRIAS